MNGPPKLTPYDEISLAIGKLTIRWSMVESGWHLIFLSLYGIEKGGGSISMTSVNALYHSHRSFAGQRRMVFSYAKAILGDDPRLTRLGQLSQATEKLAGMRNAVQHASFMFMGPSPGDLRLGISPLNPSKKLADKDIVDEIAGLIPEVNELIGNLGLWATKLRGISGALR